ncbi:MAG: hypothetical protein ABFS32_02130 [Bacteroidota bacterium]
MIRKRSFGDRKENIKKQLNILVQLAKADRDYDQEEKLFIRDFGKKYNISRSELEEIERNPDYFTDISTFTLDEKVEALYNAVRLAKVDRRILPNEIIYCQEIAYKLGFRRSVIDAILPLVTDQPLELVNYSAIRRKIAPFF